MSELQIVTPNLHFIYEHCYTEFRKDVISYYEKLCIYNEMMSADMIRFETMVDFSVEWLYRTCSLEQYSDSEYYRVLEEEEQNTFYNDCHGDDEHDFREDLFTVMREMHLSFYTDDGGFHNLPFKGVW